MHFGFKLKEFTSSLFIRLLISFLIIISLLVAFILYSVVFYRGNIKEQVINYNTLGLEKTTENYENLINNIHSSILTLSLELPDAQGQDFDYWNAFKTMQKTQLLLSNPYLYLENLLLMNKNAGFTLESGRGADTDVMFQSYYNSPDYDAAFWKEQYREPYKFRVLPESSFAEVSAIGRTEERRLLPIVVKYERQPDFYTIAMARGDRIFSALGQTVNDRFYILNEQGHMLYASDKSLPPYIPKLADKAGHIIEDGVYYFYRTGASGLTYMHVVPDNTISSQVRWNFSFVLLLVLTIAISVIVSLLLSARLNKPVKRIIEAMHRWNAPLPWESGIKEFNIIHDKMNDILKTNRDIHQDMSEKESLLRYYAYSNVLKKIRHLEGNQSAWIPSDRPFVLLLFQVNYKPTLQRLDVEAERATSFIREYIHRIIGQTFTDAVTFQMEKDQILTIVFTEQSDPNIGLTLEHIRHMLEAEKDYCFLTIAASGGTDDWNEAYSIGLELLRRRTFGDDTQIIENAREEAEEAGLSPAQEEELDANLYGGNDEVVLQLVRRTLVRMRKRGQRADAVLRFAESIAHRTQKNLQQRHIDPLPVRDALEELPSCHTYERLDEILSVMIRSSAHLVREMKDKRDYIIHFVYDYLEKNYAADISLDALADKLNISRSYLSRYFKEKTGENFVDYVNSVRIEKAKKLLLQPDIRILDAAQLVGYQNANSFNRMFKKFTGSTPSEFRRNELL
ncbi:Helix-turn-helix domain-containing protein [Paenibacillus sp. UNCCL117]|uniref:AraC family transcriptional regulator n=1 Tax=unclassified Paenibacillus TaxID=185978 RepID=UPI00088144D9|nr:MULTISPECIES: AraC family transcriptional regulator [unclassified Paenibacillus]SDE02489.1 Helix-turn-helix domain-containing protein [Paenibacillus sp. cl123]SFW57228.1 Helix-turn-helix domain-containing protein [Paenibacillus sp. UNCCL117]